MADNQHSSLQCACYSTSYTASRDLTISRSVLWFKIHFEINFNQDQLLEKHPEPATCTPSHSFKCHGELVLYRPNGGTTETIATLKFCMADYRNYHSLRNSTIWESGDRCKWYKFQMLWPNLRSSSVVDQVYSMVSGDWWQKRGKRRQPVGNAWPRYGVQLAI